MKKILFFCLLMTVAVLILTACQTPEETSSQADHATKTAVETTEAIVTTTEYSAPEEVAITEYDHQTLSMFAFAPDNGDSFVGNNKCVINSTSELNAFYEQLSLDLDREGEWLLFGFEQEMFAAKKAYDDAFFETHTLVMYVVSLGAAYGHFPIDSVTQVGSELKVNVISSIPPQRDPSEIDLSQLEVVNQVETDYVTFLTLDKSLGVKTVSVKVTEALADVDENS
ncbi:MAG: membrane lipoprotein lipid attachment site-containing protein [Clostridia bacterium]|nr:membrane lipoprotein lipid attachment site-containing protein [Clostridia bacterium]